MSLLKKLAGETAIYGTSSILSRLLNFVILTPLLTREFEEGGYGIVSDLYAWAALLMVLFTYRMETTFFRFGNRKEDLERSYSTASLSLMASTAVFLSLFWLLAPEIAAWLRYPDHPEYVRWFALIIAFDTLAAIPFARLRLENRPIYFAVVKTLNIVVNIIFIYFFFRVCPWLSERGYDWASNLFREEYKVGYVVISNLIASTSVMLLLVPEYRKLHWQFDTQLWKRMIRYAAPLIIVGIAGVINQLVGIPMLKRFASEDLDYNLAMAGTYGAAAKLAVLMNLFTQAFNYAAEPFFFRHSEREDKAKVYAQVGQGFALVGSLAFLGIMLYMDVVKYYLGENLRGGIGVVPLLLLAYLMLGLYYNFSIWYKLADRTSIGGYIAVGGSIITISLNYWLIPDYEYMAPGWAALACYTFMAGMSYWTGQRYYPIHYPMGRMLTYILVAVGIYGISLYTERTLQLDFWASLALSTIFMLSYLVFLLMLERDQVRQLLRRVKS